MSLYNRPDKSTTFFDQVSNKGSALMKFIYSTTRVGYLICPYFISWWVEISLATVPLRKLNWTSLGAHLKYSLWGRRIARAPRTIVHRTEPRARSLRHWTRVLCAPNTKWGKSAALHLKIVPFSSVSSQIKDFISSKCHQYGLTFFCWIFCWSVKHIMAQDGPSNNEIPPYQGARPKVKYMAHVSQNSLNYICSCYVPLEL